MFRIEYYDSLDSTNNFIKERKTESEGLVIVSKKQTNGRGQGNNIWSSQEGGLYFSILLKPEKLLSALSIMSGWSVLKTLESFDIDNLKLKWANDILYFDSKISGILIESKISNNKPDYVILGCGINVNQIEFNNVIEYSPISMNIIKNKLFDMNLVLTKFLEIFEKNYLDYINGKESFFYELQSNIYMKDKKIKILLHNSNIIEGILDGIDKTGALILLDSENNKKLIYSGRLIKN
jgi:BirA family biotin operon repressor/biotin-[acetyl-CoA-carboxylase] ligase